MNGARIRISETFLSVQGEGTTTGMPAIFLRTSGCTLRCQYCPLTGYVTVRKKGVLHIKKVQVEDELLCVDDDFKIAWTIVVRKELEKVKCGYRIALQPDARTFVRKRDSKLWVTESSRVLLSSGEWVAVENLQEGAVLYAKRSNEYVRMRMKTDNPSSTEEGRKRLQNRATSEVTRRKQSEIRKHLYATGQVKPHVNTPEQLEKASVRMRTNNPTSNAEVHARGLATRKQHQEMGLIKPYVRSKEWRARVSARMKVNNPMRKFENVIKVLQRRRDRPTGMEKKFMALLEKRGLSSSVQYVGNGALWIGKQNPDFVIAGQNKVIELVDSTMRGRDVPTYTVKRVANFEARGFKCLILDWADKPPRNEILKRERLIRAVEGFIHNGLVVSGKKLIYMDHLPGARRMQLETAHKLTCSPYSNYFVGNAVHHNCDSIKVWTKGKIVSVSDLIREWTANGWYDKLRRRLVNLVLTGGSPLMQQKQLTTLLAELADARPPYTHKDLPYVEVETECTLVPTMEFDYFINQYNVSPKLANSGMPESKRIVPKALAFHATHPKSYFKFVVVNKADVEEAEKTFITPFKIDPRKVILMPEGSTADVINPRCKELIEICKERGYRFSTRLQVLVWGKTTGV